MAAPARPVLVALASLALTGCATVAEGIDCEIFAKGGESGIQNCHLEYRQEREARALRKVDGPACERGDPAACDRAASFDEKRADFAGAAEGYRRACDGGIAGACRQLGLLHRDRKLARSDPPWAFASLRRACTLGDAPGCAAASPLAPDVAERGQLAERACTLGSLLCATAGGAVAGDRVRASRLYRRGCRAHDHDACVALGRLAVSAP